MGAGIDEEGKSGIGGISGFETSENESCRCPNRPGGR